MTRFFDAIYHEQTNPVWRGNPLISALDKPISDRDFASLVSNLPPFEPEERQLPAEERRTRLCRCEAVFVPFTHHLSLHQRINRLLRVGYEHRNPVHDLNQVRFDGRVDQLRATLKYGLAPYQSGSVQGFALTGVSGLGKSTSVRSVLRLLPQVIHHDSYQDNPLQINQLVWLMLDCPEDGSLKSLCKAIFAEIDQIFDQTYLQQYGKDSFSVSQMLPHLARVAALANLGVLVIDETQYLSAKRSQGAEIMLGFFTRLANIIGVPVVLVGTPEAEQILSAALHQVRRNSGQGEMRLRNLDRSDWNRYVKALWEYQFLRNAQPLTEPLSDTLYRLSRGVVGFATKMFIVAQERSINQRLETITKEVLESVAATDFTNAVEKLRELYSERDPQFKSALKSEEPSAVEPPITPKPSAKKKNISPSTSGPAECQSVGEPTMLTAATDALSSQKSVYEVMRAVGFVRNSSEFQSQAHDE